MSFVIDNTHKLSPNYNKDGLIAAIVQDIQSGDVLMMAWMNPEAFEKTIETGEAHYWSRSRNELWHKGATSGATQKVKEVLIDCDQDAVLLLVSQSGNGACHTGRRSCFYRRVDSASGETALTFLDKQSGDR